MNMEGYKVFKPDWTCRGFQYQVGETYEEKVIPVCCDRGFHFCTDLKDCFSYYDFNPNNKVAKVIALGDIDHSSKDSKCCTNKIQIVEEITWEEVLRLVNLGKGCSGFCNSGNRNSGNRNSGDCNSGDCNSGDWNSGNCNSGDCNSGDCNSGNRNSGDCNSGDWNSGDCNSGDCNSGNRNSGNRNGGNRNSGNRNSGDWNKCNYSNGCFNTEEPKIYLFNKPSDWTYMDWIDSNARYLLNKIPTDVLNWVYSESMTDQEKQEHPEHETTGGFLKMIEKSKSSQEWWNSLPEYQKNIIKEIPNFDPDIFEEITGIQV